MSIKNEREHYDPKEELIQEIEKYVTEGDLDELFRLAEVLSLEFCKLTELYKVVYDKFKELLDKSSRPKSSLEKDFEDKELEYYYGNVKTYLLKKIINVMLGKKELPEELILSMINDTEKDHLFFANLITFNNLTPRVLESAYNKFKNYLEGLEAFSNNSIPAWGFGTLDGYALNILEKKELSEKLLLSIINDTTSISVLCKLLCHGSTTPGVWETAYSKIKRLLDEFSKSFREPSEKNKNEYGDRPVNNIESVEIAIDEMLKRADLPNDLLISFINVIHTDSLLLKLLCHNRVTSREVESAFLRYEQLIKQDSQQDNIKDKDILELFSEKVLYVWGYLTLDGTMRLKPYTNPNVLIFIINKCLEHDLTEPIEEILKLSILTEDVKNYATEVKQQILGKFAGKSYNH